MRSDAATAEYGASLSPYAAKRCVVATMHGKEQVIAPVLQARLGMAVMTPLGLDTDSLGTFTGEIARAGSMDEAAIAKARLGMRKAGLSLGVASEGSYGPHPQVPFIAAGLELMVLVDDERGIIVREHLFDPTPAFDHMVAASIGELDDFLNRIGFPEHAVIVRPNVSEMTVDRLHKGLRATAELGAAIKVCAALSEDSRALVQTDMRAHLNPTRMALLARLAERFADRIACLCPACQAPGFGKVGQEPGLPCAWCGGPSTLIRHQIFGCVACDFSEAHARSDGLVEADPAHCPSCNP